MTKLQIEGKHAFYRTIELKKRVRVAASIHHGERVGLI